jgi:hypothetical protein
MRHLARAIAALLLVLSASAAASDAGHDQAARKNFTPAEWTDGLHLIAGAALTETRLHSDVAPDRSAWGVGIKTEVGYWFDNSTAIELSSFVNLTRLGEDFLLWDTQFALGVRRRIGAFFSVLGGEPYARLHGGYGPAVAVYSEGGIDRHQIGGPLAGIAIGQVYGSGGASTWFGELGFVAHWFRNREAVRDAGVLPVILARDAVTDGSFVMSLQLSASWLAF